MHNKKLLYIANIRIPTEKAHGDQIVKMCQTFTQLDYQVELIVPNRKNPINTDPFIFYKIKNFFVLKKIKVFDPIFLLKFPSGWYIRLQSIFFMFSLFFFLLFKKDKEKYIFYTRDEYLLPILSIFSKKIVWESHALPEKRNFYQKYFKSLYKIVVLTQYIKEELIKLGVKEDKILVSPSAVDLEIFSINISTEEARNMLNLPQDKVILGYTGNFKTKSMDKGIADILQALKILNKENKNILFIAVGGSQVDIDFYQSIAKQYSLEEQAIFLPKVEQKKLAIYQKAFDVLLMPFPKEKHYSYFMSPLKMFEYMAARKPIITSDLPAVRDILSDEDCAFVKPNDVLDLVAKINQLLSNEHLCQNIANNAFSKVHSYTWLKRAEKIINFISF